ncbi:hypothetical protein BK003_01435 [bacterium CG09_39_24]|nr:MAG: hypothetical protein BK003_01435 [bacterium CG09_39_24]
MAFSNFDNSSSSVILIIILVGITNLKEILVGFEYHTNFIKTGVSKLAKKGTFCYKQGYRKQNGNSNDETIPFNKKRLSKRYSFF